MAGAKTIDDIVAADVAANPSLLAIPDIDLSDVDWASIQYTQHQTKLSTHRTALSTRRTEMSMRRTGMSFQRTRISADRTLMSVVRTALALISFGFTIFQFFQHLQEQKFLDNAHAARNFGLALVYLGVGMLIVGIAYHVQFMIGLRRERREMTNAGLVHAQSHFPVSFTLLVAVLLLLLGIIALTNLTFRNGPFG